MALKHIHDTCKQYQLPVCICGELAGDPMGALLLIGLGYETLSMNTSNVARTKYLIRQSKLSELQNLANEALSKPYGSDIYSMMLNYFEEREFTGFIRAGKK